MLLKTILLLLFISLFTFEIGHNIQEAIICEISQQQCNKETTTKISIRIKFAFSSIAW